MPGFNDGLNMISKRPKRFKTNSKGYALKNLRDRFVIDNDGKYSRNQFSFGVVNLDMLLAYISGDINHVGGYMSLKFRTVSG